MEERHSYRIKGGKRLRGGYTTGTCAAAAALAAARWLLEGQAPPAVQVTTPAGPVLRLEVAGRARTPEAAACAVRKDGGDDPDVTHGLLVWAAVEKAARGVCIRGGEGVGRVTKPGLSCPVGEAAINPVPRAMIRSHLEALAAELGYGGGFGVTISIPGGGEVAKGTFNPRLGIVGGLSVLGTTGLVEPMSNRALADAVRAEIDVRLAEGKGPLLLTPGNYGRAFLESRLGIPEERAVLCSNLIGEALDHAVYRGAGRILLVGHAGKLVKLAAGVFQTHSAVADARMEVLMAHAALAGASPTLLEGLLDCATVQAAHELLKAAGLAEPTWAGVSRRIDHHLAARAGEGARVEHLVFLGEETVMASAGAAGLVEELAARPLENPPAMPPGSGQQCPTAPADSPGCGESADTQRKE